MTLIQPQPLGGGTGGSTLGFDSTVLLDGVPGGIAFVPSSTPLISLNYYDGRFLRADDLNLERRAQRAYVDFSNRAGGPGLVHGFDVSLGAGATLQLSDGLAIDPAGRVLFLPESVSVTISDLLAAASGAASDPGASTPGVASFAPCEVATSTPLAPVVAGSQMYLVAIAHTEGLCGNAEVFGRLCDDACVTATDRPYVLDGVVVLVVPLVLASPLPTSSSVTLTDTHLRSRVTSAYFADEWLAGGSLLSAAGLSSNVWCHGAPPLVGDIVPVGILGWKGAAVSFLDEWGARRELMETSPRRYWQGRMEMRPWPTFLAQVLQFQCQLAGLTLDPQLPPPDDDACDQARELLGESTEMFEGLLQELTTLGWDSSEVGLAQFELFKSKVAAVVDAAGPSSSGAARILVDGGICELPAAGYLPVDPAGAISLREQVQRLMGAGIDLRLCAVRRDQIAHELERAQHMNRISLLRGLDDPTNLEEVDILVPDGSVVQHDAVTSGIGLDVDMTFGVVLKQFEGEAQPVEEVAEEAAPAEDAPSYTWYPKGNVRGPAATNEFVSAAVDNPKVLPIRGAARLDWGSDGIRASFAGAGVADDGMRVLLRLLVSVTGEAADLDESVVKLKRANFGTGAPTLEELQALARTMERGAVNHRATNRQGRVISLAKGEENQIVAVGATAWTNRNPFEMSIGESSAVSATLDLFMPSTRSAALSIRVDGKFDVLNIESAPKGLLVHIGLTGLLSGDGINLHEGDGARRFDTRFRLLLGSKDGQQIVYLAPEDGEDWIALSAWSGTPIEGEAALVVPIAPATHDRYKKAAGGRDAYLGNLGQSLGKGMLVGSKSLSPLDFPGQHLFDARGVQDDQINTVGNTFHDRAIAALGILQGIHPDEPEWSDQAAEALFPTTTKTATTEILPTTDWVLFRRRRREDCGEVVTPSVAPSRVAAWVATAQSEEEAGFFAEMMHGGSIGKIPWNRVDTVEFEPSTATLRTPTQGLRVAYQGVSGGSLIRFAGYASNGVGDSVGVTRASTLATALPPAGVLDDQAIIDVVVQPPAEQMVTGTDGSIFLVSYEPDAPPAHLGCVEVIGIDRQRELGQEMEKALYASDEVAVDVILQRDPEIVYPLGSVDVEGGIGDVSGTQDLLNEVLQKLAPPSGMPLRTMGIGWIAWDQTTDEKAQADVDIRLVAEAVPASIETSVEADFVDPERCRNRLYLVIYPDDSNW